MKNKEWLKEEVYSMYPSYDEIYTSPDYDTVAKVQIIDEALELIDQLDEPAKVVIPQFVADYIKDCKETGITLACAYDVHYSSKLADWLYEQCDNINIEAFAKAWLDGFTIASENQELWKPIENYEGLYEVSNRGNVRSLDRDVQYKKTDFAMKIKGVDLKPNVLKKGYLQVALSKSGKQKYMLVHRLVMNAFDPTTDESLQINHIDGDKDNNEVSNLEWVTAIENTNHAYDIGLRDDTIGNNRKLTEDEVLEIIDLYETRDYNQKELGNKYNVGRNTIGEILLGKTWGWLTGITREVEKEQKYHVVNKENYFMLRKYDGLVDILHVSSSMSRDEFGKDTRFMLTEKEIKDYDERYWDFAVEAIE